MTTRMWEARAAAGRLSELVAYVSEVAVPGASVYRSEEAERVVVIDPTGSGVPEPPGELLARPAHSWDFEPVPR